MSAASVGFQKFHGLGNGSTATTPRAELAGRGRRHKRRYRRSPPTTTTNTTTNTINVTDVTTATVTTNATNVTTEPPPPLTPPTPPPPDFILVDNRDSKEPKLTPEQAAAMCDRNFGIGGDGVIFALPGDAIKMEVSLAELPPPRHLLEPPDWPLTPLSF